MSGVSQESQSHVARLQNTDSSKETFAESDIDSGRNSINQSSVFNDTQHQIHRYITDLSTENNVIWDNPPNISSYGHVVETHESVVYHDPVEKTREENDEVSTLKDSSDVFVTVARKQSVVIAVDKWTTEALPVKETPVRIQANGVGPLDNVIYAVVKKDKSKNVVVEKVNQKPEEDVCYGIVNKQTKTKQQNTRQTDLVDENYGHCTQNRVGVSDDIYNDITDNDETLYAYVDGKVMVVSEEGDYASVKSLSDSDISTNTEQRNSVISVDTLIAGTECQNSKVQPKSEADLNKLQNRYAMQYLGSYPVDEKDLSPQLCNALVGRCILHASTQSSQNPATCVYEWQKDTKMVMEISENKSTLKLLDCHSLVCRTDHFLHSIRIWAVGREANSKHFAYVIRNGSQKHVCRVFLCDVAARHVATTIRNICHRLANQEVKKEAESKRISMASLGESSPKELPKNAALRRETAGASPKSSVNRASFLITCNYIGVVQVNSSTGKDTVNNATEVVFGKMSKDNWAAVHLQISPTDIEVKEISKSGGQVMLLPVDSVTYIGSSTQNKKLAAILIQSNNNAIHAHVFHCEPTAKELVQRIENICKINPSAVGNKHKNSKEDIPKQKGLKGALFGKLKAK